METDVFEIEGGPTVPMPEVPDIETTLGVTGLLRDTAREALDGDTSEPAVQAIIAEGAMAVKAIRIRQASLDYARIAAAIRRSTKR